MTDKRKIKIIPLFLAVLCLLCSCGKKENEPFDIEKCVSPNKNINRMFLKKYSQDEIEKLYDFVFHFEGTIEELNEEYPIKCVRKYEGNEYYGTYYRISYLGEKSIGQAVYRIDTEEIYARRYKFSCPKRNFKKFKVGTHLDEVMETDPDGCYLFLYTGMTDAPKTSQHYTKDGYLITIDYDDDCKITKINEELI